MTGNVIGALFLIGFLGSKSSAGEPRATIAIDLKHVGLFGHGTDDEVLGGGSA